MSHGAGEAPDLGRRPSRGGPCGREYDETDGICTLAGTCATCPPCEPASGTDYTACGSCGYPNTVCAYTCQANLVTCGPDCG